MSTKYAAKFGAGLQNTIDAIRSLSDFDAGNLTGTTRPYWEGILPRVWREDFEEARREGKLLYAVYSYRTPIAWRVEGEGWVYPSVTYSPTTSGHQSVVRSALKLDYAGRTSGLVPVRTHTKAAERRAREVFA